MNYQPQTITAPDGTKLVVLAQADYLALLDSADIAAADRALGESSFTVPAAVLDAMLAGQSAVAAWRDYRGLTQTELAKKAAMLQPSLARIEGGNGRMRPATLAKLANALEIPDWALSLRD